MTKNIFENMEEMEEYYSARDRFMKNRLTEVKKQFYATWICADALLHSPIVKDNPKLMEGYQEACLINSGRADAELEALMQVVFDGGDEEKKDFIEHSRAKKKIAARNNK